jgi:branched-subunit amino acid aminotransferase/4-amino-4-deoxychorismate lyase
MKAYKDASEHIRLFRPDKNLQRLAASAKRIALPVTNRIPLGLTIDIQT